MQNLVNKLRFPVIVGSFVLFTYFGTNNFKSLNQDRVNDLKRRTSPELNQDKEELERLEKLKGGPSWMPQR